MGRKRKGDAPLPRTIRHLTGANPTNPGSVVNSPLSPAPPGRRWGPALRWHGEGASEPFDPIELGRLIRYRANDEVQWYCDANMFIAETDSAIWSALLAKKHRLVLAEPISLELSQWVADPAHNSQLAAEVAKSQSDPAAAAIRLEELPVDESDATVMEYYVNLIGLRKKAFPILASRMREALGREPTNQELSNRCKDELGDRTQLLAKSGSQAKVPANKFNDEAFVAMAVLDAIRSGRETAILTRDEDVLEQFYKLIWFLDTHYRAMLFAERYAADAFCFGVPTRLNSRPDDMFEGEVILLRKPSDELMELAPRRVTTIPIHCFLAGSQGIQLTFTAITDMRRLLDTKGRAAGLSTDKLGDRNCHICLGPMTATHGNFAAIARDVSMGFRGQNFKWKMSLLDANLALASRESFSPIVTVDPRFVIIPDRPPIVF